MEVQEKTFFNKESTPAPRSFSKEQQKERFFNVMLVDK